VLDVVVAGLIVVVAELIVVAAVVEVREVDGVVLTGSCGADAAAAAATGADDVTEDTPFKTVDDGNSIIWAFSLSFISNITL
jgi:diaminopimelate epimerase